MLWGNAFDNVTGSLVIWMVSLGASHADAVDLEISIPMQLTREGSDE